MVVSVVDVDEAGAFSSFLLLQLPSFHCSLNLGALLLIRDPRAVLASRWKRNWCVGKECRSPVPLCKDMVDDFRVLERMGRDFPGRIG